MGKYLEYYLALLGKVFFLLLPWSWAQRSGAALGLLVGHFLPQRRKIVYENLVRAFPEISYENRTEIARKVWDNIGRTAGEFIKIEELRLENLSQYVEIEGEEYIRASLTSGKGAILFSAHFCNWEIIHAALALKGYSVAGIARPLENILVNRFVNEIRESTGMKVFFARDGVARALAWLKANGFLYILLDQRITEGDIYVDFFHRPAATTSIVSLLARRTGAMVIPVYSLRNRGGRLRIKVEKPLELKKTTDEIHRQVLLDTIFFTKIIEDWIRKYPGYWFWVHNRWKR